MENKNLVNIAKIPKPLLKWYDANMRLLPWRENPEPYRVWVSEIMLQQTRVEAVKPYFDRFMDKLPDIGHLAAAPEETLLKLWEGLGYYMRVRNLKNAALQIMEEYNGRIPEEYNELMKLKGIGSYTAGAIASISFKRPVPAVDGNVLRVLSRIRKDESCISEQKVKARVEAELAGIIPRDRPGDFNQAMMEIGALVCIPNGVPRCRSCPLAELCLAHAAGEEQEYPRKAAKKARVIEQKTVLVIRDDQKAALKKRPGRGLLAGMYEFPSLEGHRTAEEVIAYLAAGGIKALQIKPLTAAKHIFSHREWHMIGYMIRVDELEERTYNGDSQDWILMEPAETEENYPIPAAYLAYTKYLGIKLGNARYQY